MATLVPVDGSQSSLDAVKYAARHSPRDGLLLLHVVPSGRQGELERGKFLLDNCRRECQVVASEVRVSTRLEIGDPRVRLREVLVEADCEMVVVGAHGVNAMPHVDTVSADISELTGELRQPVVIVLPTGQAFRQDSRGRMGSVPQDEEPLSGPTA